VPQPHPGRRPGVLVVDDDPHFLAVMSAMLRLEGYTPHPAAGAEAALALLTAAPSAAECALIDRDMPRHCGEEACRLLRAFKPGLRCWLVTGRAGGPPPVGFEGALVKPFTLADLRACLASMRAGAASPFSLGSPHPVRDEGHAPLVISWSAPPAAPGTGVLAEVGRLVARGAPPPNANRRASLRRPPKGGTRLRAHGVAAGAGANIAAAVLDVSRTGARLLLTRDLAPGQEFEVDLEGPGAPPVVRLARAVWSAQAEGGRFVVGAAFGSPLSPDDLYALAQP
jgi:CheY-like chemotaxis protein